MTEPREKPISFSAPMVLAILDGRKTQTRRVAKLTIAGHVKEPRGHRRWHPGDPEAVLACPYGQPGDRLWVKETWQAVGLSRDPESMQVDDVCECPPEAVKREMSGEARRYPQTGIIYRASCDDEFLKWRPSIFMPRWASRIALEITDVRVQRVQEISETDAIAELGGRAAGIVNEIGHFAELWDTLYAKRGYSWESNLWVWAITFKRIKP